MEDTSDKGGDCAVLQCANSASAHGLGGSSIVISLLDKTHICVVLRVREVLEVGVGVLKGIVRKMDVDFLLYGYEERMGEE